MYSKSPFSLHSFYQSSHTLQYAAVVKISCA